MGLPDGLGQVADERWSHGASSGLTGHRFQGRLAAEPDLTDLFESSSTGEDPYPSVRSEAFA